jgi:hypothetical protein
MLAYVFLVFVLILLAGGATALLLGILPVRWRRTVISWVRNGRGELRRGLGRWELVDIERYVLRRVEDAAQISLNIAYLPNRIRILFGPEDAERFQALLTQIGDGLMARINALRGCQVKGSDGVTFDMVGRVTVTLVRSGDVAPGTVGVEVGFAADTVVAGAAVVGQGSRPVEVPRLREPRWVISTQEGVRQIDQDMLVGRSPRCALRIDDGHVSGQHARLKFKDGELFLQDLNSTNGTLVNTRPVKKTQKLQSGDLLSFGGAPAMRVALDRKTLPGAQAA